MRPNQVLALSLRHPVLHEPRWRAVMEKVTQALLTPYGLRTPSPQDRDGRKAGSVPDLPPARDDSAVA